MTARVESRRFRTWQTEAETPTPPWRILMRYGWMRMMRTWWIVVPFILAVVAAVWAVGVLSFSAAVGSGVSYWAVTAAVGSMAFNAGVLLLLAGSGTFSEDIRFHAPLFYFSRPLTTRQYVAGKGAQVASLVAVAAVAPVLIMLVLVSIVGIASEPVDWDGTPLHGTEQARWEYTHIDTVADILYTWAFVLPGVVVSAVFLVAVMLAVSASTRRAWHSAVAAVALLGAWTALGVTAADPIDNVLELTLHPFGWMTSVVSVPLQARFDPGTQTLFTDYPSTYLDHAGAAVLLSYVLLLATSALALWIADRRLRDVEGVL